MKGRYAIIALLLLCSACDRTHEPAKPAATAESSSATDPAFVAEDPSLAARLVGVPGPAITLKPLSGPSIDLRKIYGKKPVYLKVWATYCLPCRAQMPKFQSIFQTYGDQMQVVAVDAGVGDDLGKVRDFVSKFGLTMPVAVDDGGLGAFLQMHETPFHVLIGRDGRIAWVGHQDGPALDAAIQKVLASSASATPVAASQISSVAVLKPGDLVPALDLVGQDGQPIRFQKGATGKPRALYFSAVWCEDYLKQTEPDSVAACKRNREQADQLSQDSSVQWLGVFSNLWTKPKELAAYQAAMKPKTPVAIDADGLAFRTFGIKRFPAVALVGADGRLVKVIGPEGGDLAASVRALKFPPAQSKAG